MLTINPSYQTREVTYGSCPCNDSNLITPGRPNETPNPPCANWGAGTPNPEKWAHNVPLYHGDSVLGVFGDTNFRFSRQPLTCPTCDDCQNNTVTPLFYKSARSYAHPTYAFQYKGKDNYYRRPY